MSEEQGALFIAHVNARRKFNRNGVHEHPKAFPERPKKGNEEILKSKKFLSLPHSSVRLTWKKPFQ